MISLTLSMCALALGQQPPTPLSHPANVQPRTDFYGMPLPEGALSRMGSIRFRQHFSPTNLAYSADGRILASGDIGVIRLWNATTGEPLRGIPFGPQTTVRFLFSHDSKTLIWGGDRVICIADVATGRELRRIPVSKLFYNIALSSDGALLAGASAGSPFRVWELASGKEVGQLAWKGDMFAGMTWVPGTGALAIRGLSYPNTYFCRLWDVRTKKETSLPPNVYLGFPIAFSPDGKTVAAGTTRGEIRLHDRTTGKDLGRLQGHRFGFQSLDFSPDGGTLASVGADDKTVRVWRVADRKEIVRLDLPNGKIAFSPDGKTLAVGNWPAHIIRFWDVASGKERFPSAEPNNFGSPIAFLPGGKILLAASGEGLWFWNVLSGKPARLALSRIPWGAMVLSSDKKTLAIAADDQSVHLWDINKRQALASFNPKRLDDPSLVISAQGRQSVALSGDDRLLAVANLFQTLALFDVEARKLIGSMAIRECSGLALSPDGKTLVSVARDIDIIDVGTRKIRLQLKHPASQVAVVFSPNGEIVAVVNDRGSVRLWRAGTGEILLDLSSGLTRPRSIMFSPDGARLAVSGAAGLCVWDLVGSANRRMLRDPSGPLHGLIFSPDGKQIATGNDNGTIVIWNAEKPFSKP